jgi:hypothetical protein
MARLVHQSTSGRIGDKLGQAFLIHIDGSVFTSELTALLT